MLVLTLTERGRPEWPILGGLDATAGERAPSGLRSGVLLPPIAFRRPSLLVRGVDTSRTGASISASRSATSAASKSKNRRTCALASASVPTPSRHGLSLHLMHCVKVLRRITGRTASGGTMSKLRCHISISIDGFVAGPNQSEEHPLGADGERLHDWAISLAAWRELHGMQGGQVNESTRVMEETTENVGAGIMGRNMFGPPGGGDWGNQEWKGWWGDDPPYHNDVFILTHHPRDPVEMEGGTTFHFVTDGIERALERARQSAGGKDVRLWGGAQVIQQYLVARLLDVLELHIVPVLLGDGARLFDNLGDAKPRLTQVRAVEGPGVTHLKYTVDT
jgi:dihydrofolate reductase